MTDRITFIMLTWNRKKFVEEFFISFYKNISNDIPYEFLIVDNGSSDGTKSLLREVAKKDKNIKLSLKWFNKGLERYKTLMKKAKYDYIIIVDDDIIELPHFFDKKLLYSIKKAPSFGFIALDVVQDQFTDGAKPDPHNYKDIHIEDFILQEGPAGGWFSILRKKDYNCLQKDFNKNSLSFTNGEDGSLTRLLKNKLNLKSGILKGEKCLHASGPYYSLKYGYIERDIQKYKKSGLMDYVEKYEKFKHKF